MESNGPRKKRAKRALERKHNSPLPINLTSQSTSWSQSLLTTIQWLVGYNVDSTPQIRGEYVRSSSSVRISDEKVIPELFCKGFFGKGNLSRSEPTWAQRSQHEYHASMDFLENITDFRRKQRKAEKLSKLDNSSSAGGMSVDSKAQPADNVMNISDTSSHAAEDLILSEENYKEHLELSLVESFFLMYGLGCLQLLDNAGHLMQILQCWRLFCINGAINCNKRQEILSEDMNGNGIDPTVFLRVVHRDNDFILNYVTYHYYRSKGWVVKEGLKFGVNWILYQRGPAFTHGEYAVIIIPSYPESSCQNETTITWKYILSTNRVCSQANKTLLLCYINIPDIDVKSLLSPKCLSQYSISEVTMKRWIPEKTRN